MLQPTAAELEILKLLWQQQPQTARELHDQLEAVLGWGYSSTRKTLERMGEKGFVRFETQGNKNAYVALLEKLPTLAALASDFASRVLGLNGPLPVSMFADSRLLSRSELSELEQQLALLSVQQEPQP
ncbi:MULTISPECIES: BlaI/MecI/CopY family transcriptional regulator [Rheinheimera]|uniref:BlaI/MecI/CopY family transcriptional regulator n=1 Tax=Rheinheimera marina TaxID=1774958 RepID=A0ABV9JHQ6_9GAMM